MRPLLAAADALKPGRPKIDWTRDAFLDVLRTRSSATLLRVRSADKLQRRPRFFDSADANVIAGDLNGAGLDGARFAELLTGQRRRRTADARARRAARQVVRAAPGA
jgi:hypothetical protein